MVSKRERDALVVYGDSRTRDQQTIGDQAITVSSDGLRVQRELVNLRPRKAAKVQPTPAGDEFAAFEPVPEATLDELDAYAAVISSYDIEPLEEDSGKSAKRPLYDSAHPMNGWVRMRDTFLDELLRRDGLGDYHTHDTDTTSRTRCAICDVAYGPDTRIFRCPPCGEYLQCQRCIVEHHSRLPLHGPLEWNGQYWTPCELHDPRPDHNSLHMVYQLGHHGYKCLNPTPARLLVVVDARGIFRVRVQFCGCSRSSRTNSVGQLLRNGWYPATVVDPDTCFTFEALELFRALNVVGNLNTLDFIKALEYRGDPARVTSTPVRFRLGNDNSGFAGTGPGELAIWCWACPRDGRNLPEKWREVAPTERYLYAATVAIDANFRLKNRIRANEYEDSPLAFGRMYFGELRKYLEHLKGYVKEEDITTCIAFAALLLKDTKVTKGLRVSGVGGCVCARHGLILPLGIGDLQKGERYSNMDWIVLSALRTINVEDINLSYDIACQWKVNFERRAKVIAEKDPDMPLLERFRRIQYGLPNALGLLQGLGKTDGEAIERTWSVLNPAGFATKEMSLPARMDCLEDRMAFVNEQKNYKQGDSLCRKHIIAVTERAKQVEEFIAINESVPPNLRIQWLRRLEAWNKDHSGPNPYIMEGGKEAGPTEREMVEELKKAELEEARESTAPLPQAAASATAFLKAGLAIEDAQRRIKAELKSQTLVTADRSSQVQETRLSTLKKIRAFYALQDTYMPGVQALREQAEEERDPDAPPPKSGVERAWRTRRQRYGRGRCNDTIGAVRTALQTRQHLINFRDTSAVGQAATTRSANWVSRWTERIGRRAASYNASYDAFLRLKSAEAAPELHPMRKEDLSARLPVESDARAVKKMGHVDHARGGRSEPTEGQMDASKGYSWIWFVGGVANESNLEALRVEWTKARARRDRWDEEVALIREEMRRVLRSLRWEEKQWLRRVGDRSGVLGEISAGADAYARQQSALHRAVAERFIGHWSGSVASAMRSAMRDDGVLYRQLLEDGVVEVAGDLHLERVEAAAVEAARLQKEAALEEERERAEARGNQRISLYMHPIMYLATWGVEVVKCIGAQCLLEDPLNVNTAEKVVGTHMQTTIDIAMHVLEPAYVLLDSAKEAYKQQVSTSRFLSYLASSYDLVYSANSKGKLEKGRANALCTHANVLNIQPAGPEPVVEHIHHLQNAVFAASTMVKYGYKMLEQSKSLGNVQHLRNGQQLLKNNTSLDLEQFLYLHDGDQFLHLLGPKADIMACLELREYAASDILKMNGVHFGLQLALLQPADLHAVLEGFERFGAVLVKARTTDSKPLWLLMMAVDTIIYGSCYFAHAWPTQGSSKEDMIKPSKDMSGGTNLKAAAVKKYFAATDFISQYADVILEALLPKMHSRYEKAFLAGRFIDEDSGPFLARAVLTKVQVNIHRDQGDGPTLTTPNGYFKGGAMKFPDLDISFS
ncbi:CxC2 domain-containing protein [Mycena kentingensis (nom. inval.)]|nr:CxC2 domain-containing protein [Mycena kentingensis (nom. inval.)]